MFQPIIRTITLGLADAHPLSRETVLKAKAILEQAHSEYTSQGYQIQTIRISTRPLFIDLATWSDQAIISYVRDLQQLFDEVGLEYCSLGAVPIADPSFPLARIPVIADVLINSETFSITAQLATVKDGIRYEAAIPIADIIRRLAYETDEGFGNFRFAMLACVDPGSPFFPAAYHQGATTLSLGLQGVSIITHALQQMGANGKEAVALPAVTTQIQAALKEYISPIIDRAHHFLQNQDIRFGGIDVSPAPLAQESIAAAIELCGYGPVGSYGTLAVAAAFTAALKNTGLPTCGYSGLMLPVLEDSVLGQRWSERKINAQQLLLYSAVCGTGLDTIPLPGDSSATTIAHLLLDVASLATRYQKPLSARLFPVPQKQAGEYTTFTSPYLSNTRI